MSDDRRGTAVPLFGQDRQLFESPTLDSLEIGVLEQIDALRRSLRFQLVQPRRWSGSLRRLSFARNIQGSNSIEGYDARLDDAAAVALGEEPLDADHETRLALSGYRSAMTYVLQLVQEPDLQVSEDLVRSLHFMMTSYDLAVRPGRWRVGPVYVQRERTHEIVHEGADAKALGTLMPALVTSINRRDHEHSIVSAAMAHLNLVMIHPFKDGNGRMARCVQGLVLASDGVLAPVFMSIEEYLGRNTESYYEVLALTGGGGWDPSRSARPWLRFALTAHLRQAQTLQRRVADSERIWSALERLTAEHRLPDRTIGALYEATLGLRVRNATYRASLADSGEPISEQIASRDLNKLVQAGLLIPSGERRGRVYRRGQPLEDIRAETVAARNVTNRADPFAT